MRSWKELRMGRWAGIAFALALPALLRLALARLPAKFIGLAAGAGVPVITAAIYSIGIAGFVPTLCRVDADLNVNGIAGGTVDLGPVTEFCNAPAGYDLWIDTSPADLAGLVFVDGTPIPLSNDGHTRIVQSATAGKRTHYLRLELGEERLDEANLRIVAR